MHRLDKNELQVKEFILLLAVTRAKTRKNPLTLSGEKKEERMMKWESTMRIANHYFV